MKQKLNKFITSHERIFLVFDCEQVSEKQECYSIILSVNIFLTKNLERANPSSDLLKKMQFHTFAYDVSLVSNKMLSNVILLSHKPFHIRPSVLYYMIYG